MKKNDDKIKVDVAASEVIPINSLESNDEFASVISEANRIAAQLPDIEGYKDFTVDDWIDQYDQIFIHAQEGTRFATPAA